MNIHTITLSITSHTGVSQAVSLVTTSAVGSDTYIREVQRLGAWLHAEYEQSQTPAAGSVGRKVHA